MTVNTWPATNIGGTCQHGTPRGGACWYCMYPAGAWPVSPQQPAFHLGGWACPGCGHCFSPAITQCPYCSPHPATTATSTTGFTAPDSGDCEGGICGHDDEEDQPAPVCRKLHCDC